VGERILIVGAGQAGMQIAVSLRDAEFDGPITMIGEEPHGPYQRPPLSKAFLAGESDEESLELRSPAFYVENNIVVITDEQVVDVRWDAAHGTAITNTGREVAFDKLALTTGADVRRLDVEGVDLDGVLYLRGLADAKALKSRWDAASNVVVIGGGFIGLEVAAVARKNGKTTTIVHRSERLMSRVVSPTTSKFFKEAHERRGTTVLLNAQISRLVGESGKVTGVELADGTVIPADIVMIGVGVVPRGDLAAKLGLELAGDSIVVDAFARTSDARIVAAGDAVVMPHPLTGEGQVALESVQNAVDQAKVAANTLMGLEAEYRAVPWFWSDQDTMKLQMAGISAGYDETVVRGNPDDEKFSVIYYRDGRLIAIDSVNEVLDYMAVRKALGAGQTIPADKAGDTSVKLKELVED
jgi:3-phenylpropionate/trans-cinnamate dioxygenase ferredoxin reductase subunit